MKLILLTQDDPFYLPETVEDLIKKLKNSQEHTIISAIVSNASPFGKSESFLKKILRTYLIFGIRFFLFYSVKYIYNKFILRKNVTKVLDKNGIPLWRLESDINNKENVIKLRDLDPDLVIIIAGNQIIKKPILDIPKHGIINAHSSLLPKYRGLMPTFWVLKNNEKETGVTVYKLTEGIDSGPIINSRKIEIGSTTTQTELVRKCKYLANELIIEALELVNMPENFKKNEGLRYYKFPTRDDVIEFYRNKKHFF
jgi:methionyl-tRNA formyltransferase